MVGQYPQTTFEPVSEFGRLVNGLFANTFIWTIGILVLVEVLLLVFIFKFRDRPGLAEPKQIHGHTGLEITWTLIPAVIVLFIAVPTVRGIFAVQAKTDESALIVEVIGHQWWWEFNYPQLGVSTANELVLPVNRTVDLKMHSADVIHSYWVPRIMGKRDVNPQPRTTKDERARINHLTYQIEQPGYYSGQCAEFCGASHGLMRTAVVALTEAEFGKWVQKMGGAFKPVEATHNAPHGQGTAEKDTTGTPEKEGGVLGQRPDTLTVADTLKKNESVAAPTPQIGAQINPLAPTGAPAPGRGVPQSTGPIPLGSADQAALIAHGKQLITTKMCVACHTIQGTTMQGKLGPNLTAFGARKTVGAGAAPATLENIERWIHRPQDLKPGALMPGAVEGAAGMPGTGLTQAEIKAIAAYLKSLQ